MTNTVVWALVLAIGGAALAGVGAPEWADYLLDRRIKRIWKWYDESAAAYREWMDSHDGARPDASSKDSDEAALGIWANDALRSMELGALEGERLDAVQALGLEADPKKKQRAEAVDRIVGTVKATTVAAARASVPGLAKSADDDKEEEDR